MTNQPDKYQRTILPIPDQPHTGLTTYDAKDPNTKFPPIEPVPPSKHQMRAEFTYHNGHLVDPEEYIKVLIARQ